MKEFKAICPHCNADFGISLTPYLAFLQDEWEAIVWCKCQQYSFGIRLTLVEDNVTLSYKKVQLITTESEEPSVFIYDQEKPNCEVCGKQNDLGEVGLYWVCPSKKCINTATQWCHRDISECST